MLGASRSLWLYYIIIRILVWDAVKGVKPRSPTSISVPQYSISRILLYCTTVLVAVVRVVCTGTAVVSINIYHATVVSAYVLLL